jgi:hypothetical protein
MEPKQTALKPIQKQKSYQQQSLRRHAPMLRPCCTTLQAQVKQAKITICNCQARSTGAQQATQPPALIKRTILYRRAVQRVISRYVLPPKWRDDLITWLLKISLAVQVARQQC